MNPVYKYSYRGLLYLRIDIIFMVVSESVSDLTAEDSVTRWRTRM